MKTLLTAILFIISVSTANAQNTTDGEVADGSIVSPDSAKYHEGTLTVVCGKVTGTHVGKNGIMKLNFGGEYPNNTFTAVVFAENVSKFKSPEEYEGKNLCVTGQVELFKGKAEIVLKTPNQLKEQ